MAKEKSKGTRGPPNKHLSARINFLQQAALHLAGSHSNEAAKDSKKSQIDDSQGGQNDDKRPFYIDDDLPNGSASHMALQLRQVALKSQIRLQPSTKHFSCKSCHTVLLEGRTCRKYMENLSSGGKKPHADAAVLQCMTCGTKKRSPVNALRQPRKSMRRLTLREETMPPAKDPLDPLPT